MSNRPRTAPSRTPRQTPVVKVEAVRELGDTGLKRSYGQVREEFLPQLQGDRAVKVFREMGDNDPTVGAMLYALENTVRQVSWATQGPSAGFVDECINDMSHSWEDFIAEAISKLQYGWAFHEIVYKVRDDGQVGWAKFPIRGQDTLSRWELDDNGGIRGMYQTGEAIGYREVFIPIDKALLFRTSTRKNNPQGKSVLRNAYRPWHFKKRIEEIEAVGVERDLAGIPKIGVPPEVIEAGGDVYEAYKQMGRDLRNDEQSCVIMPRAFDEGGNLLYDIELMASGGRRAFVTGEIIQRKAQEIAMSCLADVILLGHEGVGSFALSESKEKLLTVGLQAQVDEIAAVFNRWAIPRLLMLNGIEPDGTKIVAGEIQSVDLKSLAEVIWKLSMAGMAFFPSPEMEARIRALADLPEAEGTETSFNPNTGESRAQGGSEEQ